MSRGKDRGGVSLVEVVVALVVFQLSVLSAIALFERAHRLLTEARAVDQAVSMSRSITDAVSRGREATTGSRVHPDVTVLWAPTGSGGITLVAFARGDTTRAPLLRVRTGP